MPVVEFDLDRLSRYRDRTDCLEAILLELGRNGLSRGDLPAYQRHIFSDLLHEPLDEWAIGRMHRYWEYNLELLFKRKRGWEPQGVPGKPRIDVTLEITSKGNFKAEWRPRGWDNSGPPLAHHVGSDFAFWNRYTNRFQAFDSRPTNELFFIHDVGDALGHLRRPEPSDPFAPVNQVLLCACDGLVRELKERLEPHFDVRMCTDLFLDWRPVARETASWFEPEDLVSWIIEDPAERRARDEQAELAAMEREFGTTREKLVDCWAAEAAKTKGAIPGTHAFNGRLQKALKAAGGTTTPRQLVRLLQLIGTHDRALAKQLNLE